MTLNFNQINELYTTIQALQETKLPFKLSLIFAKNSAILKQEVDFYIEQERAFAQKYLEIDEATGQFVQTAENVFKIKEGMEEDCRVARQELDAFTSDLELRTIPVELVENLELTPRQVEALSIIIEEE
jgi:hypothetical protein